MHGVVYRAFEQMIVRGDVRGTILEVGAIPSAESLLASKCLSGAKERIGINLDEPRDCPGFRIIQGNANAMDCFEDGRFDIVLCNAVLEHDKLFWRTIREMHRVTKPGGLIVIGTPGYRVYGVEKLQRALLRVPLIRRLETHRLFNALFWATVTYQVHDAPGDFYRFSEQAVREVLLHGLCEVQVTAIMLPPRIIGSGVKPVEPSSQGLLGQRLGAAT